MGEVARVHCDTHPQVQVGAEGVQLEGWGVVDDGLQRATRSADG